MTSKKLSSVLNCFIGGYYYIIGKCKNGEFQGVCRNNYEVHDK